MPPGTRFCEACGNPLSGNPLPIVAPETPAARTQSSIPSWLVIGGIAVAAIVFCAGAAIIVGALFLRSSPSAAPVAQSADTPIPPLPTSSLATLPALVIPTATNIPTVVQAATEPPRVVTVIITATPNADATVFLPPTLAPEILATATPVPPSPTNTPVPIPTQAPAKPLYSAVTFSSAFDQDAMQPTQPGKVFPYGTKIVYAYWTYNHAVPNTPFEYAWTKNGARVDSSGENFIQSSGKTFQWVLHPDAPYTPTIPLDPGTYQFVVRVNGQVILSDSFTIQMPARTVLVFFTIKNNTPTGFVIDKQGVTHTPPGYLTISDFQVAPGDRIVIQTDQPRFSLLFDCSTSPQIYAPCDFAAATPGELPAEIIKKQNGTAYLNISRADNWAGERPGFPSQRYPADPVLRIVFGD